MNDTEPVTSQTVVMVMEENEGGLVGVLMKTIR